MSTWHDFFKEAWDKADAEETAGDFLGKYRTSLINAVAALTENGVDERDAVLWVLDVSEANKAPMRLLEAWAMDIWPEHFYEDDEETYY